MSGLKKNLASSPRSERVAMIEADHTEISVVVQADLLGVNRSSLYYKPQPESASKISDKQLVNEIFEKYPFFGYRKLSAYIRIHKGRIINGKRVLKYMNELGIQAICPGPNMSRRNFKQAVKPYLLGDIEADHINHVWGIDITYIKLRRGFMYLVAVIDWYSRYIVSWRLSDTLEITFVLETVKEALQLGTPEYWNSDQGSHFTSPQYLQMLKDLEINISMDGKGRALDNIFTERFWRSLKYEEIFLNEYDTPRILRIAVIEYIRFYNIDRPHQSLNYRTPNEVYNGSYIIKELKVKIRKRPSDCQTGTSEIICQTSTKTTMAARYASRPLSEERTEARNPGERRKNEKEEHLKSR